MGGNLTSCFERLLAEMRWRDQTELFSARRECCTAFCGHGLHDVDPFLGGEALIGHNVESVPGGGGANGDVAALSRGQQGGGCCPSAQLHHPMRVFMVYSAPAQTGAPEAPAAVSC